MLCWKSSPYIIVFTSFVGERLNFCFTEMRRPDTLCLYWHSYSSQHYHILQLFSSTFQMRFYGIFLYLSKLSYLLHWQLLKVIKINTISIFRGKSENKVKYLYVAAVLWERRYAVQIDCVFPQTIPQNTPAFIESHSEFSPACFLSI